ncbi:DNA-binding XRE family transcriptional regulator [Streptomyces sp. PvR006]|uniref:helix-turn-helix domain-containing protein n=1 Tax=unclassified Streptomyces TaxID=2593676 RepID=UPI001AE315BF|nr:helix-turn-helix domain-containing protein [Streptomyces sp. PvR006]MBP2580059.1 DNA-binding XRE family transcriptional regulator [Streptomyces sp. PvR006]
MNLSVATPHPTVLRPRRTPDLPAPATRLGLREAWGLSRAQVAAAFGVTSATVGAWESGRTSPRGARRRAYAAFLTGLAASSPDLPRPARTTAVPATPHPAHPAAPLPPRVIRALPGGLPVGPHRPDPVSRLRRRRWRSAAAAWGCWSLVLHLLLTVPVAG